MQLELLEPTKVEVYGTGKSVDVAPGVHEVVEENHRGSPWWFLQGTTHGLPVAVWNLLIGVRRAKIVDSDALVAH